MERRGYRKKAPPADERVLTVAAARTASTVAASAEASSTSSSRVAATSTTAAREAASCPAEAAVAAEPASGVSAVAAAVEMMAAVVSAMIVSAADNHRIPVVRTITAVVIARVGSVPGVADPGVITGSGGSDRASAYQQDRCRRDTERGRFQSVFHKVQMAP